MLSSSTSLESIITAELGIRVKLLLKLHLHDVSRVCSAVGMM